MSETIKKTNKVITFSISYTLRNMQDFHSSFIIDWNSKSLYLLDILRYYDVMLCSVLALYSLFILLCLLSSAFAFFPSTFSLLKMTKKKTDHFYHSGSIIFNNPGNSAIHFVFFLDFPVQLIRQFWASTRSQTIWEVNRIFRIWWRVCWSI